MRRAYDLVVIGGGSAGYNAARVAAALGRRVAVIDGARRLGGLCILRGCMPSKTLIYSAEVLHLARKGAALGLRITAAAADMRAMHARKKRIVGAFADCRVKQLESGDFDLIRGWARFVDPHAVELGDGRRFRAAHFLVSTGSRVSVPPVPGLGASPFWTSDDVLELDFKPRSVVVLGGGIVACELAQFLNRIGARVCIVQRSSQLLREHSGEAAGVVRQAFADEGIEVITDTQVSAITTLPGGVSVAFRHRGKALRRRADHLLNALGREPDTSGLSLEAAGVRTAPGGRILTNRWQQTSAPHIYAAGDCCGPHEIVHVAVQQGELAARHCAGVKGLRPMDESMLLSVIFTDPQLARIGWRERDLLERRAGFAAASYPFSDHGKSILMEAKYGYVKVLAELGSGRILGAEIVGRDAAELIHCFSTPLAMRATVHDMLRAPWYHPTLSEIVTYPLEELAVKTRGPAARSR
ncbi:MAG TPA: dihydrolipoyl dehydrogenase [Opitutaceae bacterium]|nr:dihydrolipoyl dehydrogenase [Opitutaceae bacterium]